MGEIGIDQGVYDLAKSFIEDSEIPLTVKNQRALATVIQQAIEDWFDSEESNGEQ